MYNGGMAQNEETKCECCGQVFSYVEAIAHLDEGKGK